MPWKTCCPISSRIKGYAFEVVVPGPALGALLADQVQSLDWIARRACKKDAAPAQVLVEVRAKLNALLVL